MGSVETVTVLFTDLVGSTGLATRVGPGAAEQIRREHFALLREAVDEAGGNEVKNVGDGLMVTFPGPSSAAGCAVEMQQAIELRNRRAEEQLMVRIGISSGEADLEDGDYFGPPVVEAARLCNAAAGGQILCGELVRMMAREGHAFRSVGGLELKGLPTPFPAHEIEWESSTGSAGALPLPQRLREAPPLGYVGRREERAALASVLDQASEGARRVVFLSGEPGIGKTRLASHLAVEAHGEGTTVLYGRCDEDLALPFGPWVEALRHYVREAPAEILGAHAERHGGELARLVPDARIRDPDYPAPTETDPETERYLLFAAVSGLLEEATRETPLVLVLDDLHWADRPTLSLLRHLITRGGDLRLLVIGTYRDSDLVREHPLTDLLADLHREDGVTRVPLKGLDQGEVIAIMEAAAGHDVEVEGRQLAGALVQETDGNPFYVGELLRHLLESGALVRDAHGRFRLDGTIEELGLPQSVREVVGRRIQRLSEGSRRALSVAAVIGRDFDVSLLAQVTETDEDDLLDLLDEAVEASVVNESAGAAGGFTFAHALINHTLYDELGRTRRARLHGRIALALEERCGEDPGDRIAELAHHAIRAATPDDPARAVDYARRAGERALGELAPDEALRWFEQAIELVDSSPGTAAARCDLSIGLGEAQRQLSDPAHRETLLEASRLAEELGDAERAARAALANSRGWNRVFGRVDSELVDAIGRAVDLDGLRSPARSARLIARQAAELQFDPDHERRWALTDQALALAREAGDHRTLAYVRMDYIYAVWGRESVTANRAQVDELSEQATRLGDPVLAAWANLYAVNACMREGDVEGCAAQLAALRTAVEGIGQPALRWVARYLEAPLHLLRGDLDEGERAANEALQVGMDAGQADAPMIYGSQISGLRAWQGRADEFIGMLEQAVAAYPGIPAWRGALAANYAYVGRLDEAAALVSDAVSTGLEGIPHDQIRTTALAFYADAAFMADARDAAGVLYNALEPWSDEFVYTGAGAFGCVPMWLGLLAALRGEDGLADEHLETACDLHDRAGIRYYSAYGRVCWAEALARRGDTVRACEQAEGALGAADGQGYALIERRARDVLAQPSPR